MELQAGLCLVRSWRRTDLDSLTKHANNPSVARNLRDGFPSPYTEVDAERWLSIVGALEPETQFALDVGGSAVGGIGLSLGADIHRIDAELGYWLGEELWGRGITTAAINTFVPHSFATYGLERIHAHVFESNLASARVLEKCGFRLEGRFRRAAVKNDVVIDMLVYGRIRDDSPVPLA